MKPPPVLTVIIRALSGSPLLAYSVSPVLLPGTYMIGDHCCRNGAPNGGTYFLRIDEYQGAGPHTLTVNAEGVAMFITLAGNETDGFRLRIFGTALSNHTGDIYEIDFLYSASMLDETDPGAGEWVVLPGDHSGTIRNVTDNGDPLRLTEKADTGGETFRLGFDHRGQDGVSGWGWIYVEGERDDTQDWLFRVKQTPEPSPAQG